MNGGYVMIDCKGLNLLSEASQTIDGLYEKSAEALATGKPIIVNNCEYGDGVPMTPTPVMGIEEEEDGTSTIVFTASTLQIRVSSDDSVEIVDLLDNDDDS